MRQFIFLFVLILFAAAQAEILKMQIEGKPEKLESEIVAHKDANGRFCAGIKVISDMDGFSYDAYNGVVKVDDKPGEDLVYVQPDERVLEIYHSGYEPLKIILSEIGISLNPREVWAIKISGEQKLTQIPIVIITRPEGARIFIDGKDKGNQEQQTVSSGTHSIRLIKQGFEPIIKTIQVDEKNTLFKYTLQEIEDVPVQITSKPTGATVFIDNVKFGATPLSDFYPSGKYPIRIEQDWYVTYEDFIEIKSPQTYKNYALREDFGSLTVTSTPQTGLDILLNSQMQNAKTPFTFKKLKPGTYRITTQSKFFETKEQSVEIKRQGKHQINLISESNFAVLNINTIPGAVIYLNNKKISRLKNIRMEPSLVRIRAEMPPKGKSVEKRIVLKKNENRTIDIKPEIATGTIQVAVVPFDATITLKGDAGEFYKANKSKAFKNIPVGAYNLAVKKDGYKTQTEKLLLVENKTIKRNIRLDTGGLSFDPSDHRTGKLKKTGRPSASGVHPFFKSLFVPGLGQIANGHKRGYLYFATILGIAGKYYSVYSGHSKNMDEYNSAKNSFESNPTIDNALIVNEAVKKTDESYKQGMIALYVLGGVYAINLLDALLFSSKTKSTKSYSVKPNIKNYNTYASRELLFGLTINW